MKTILKMFLLFAVVTFVSQPLCFAKSYDTKAPKNIILLISDGWGYNHIEATNCYQYGLRKGVQVYEQFPVELAMSTYSATNNGYAPYEAWSDFEYVRRYDLMPYLRATDSAASATAFSTGVKTYNGSINVSMESDRLYTIVERAEEMGKATGVVTSVPFNHATPAGMVAHNETRNDYQGIAREMIYYSGLEVIMGAGHPWYTDDNTKKDEPRYKYMDESTWLDLSGGTAGNDCNGDGIEDVWAFIDEPGDFRALANGETPDRLFGLARVYSTLQHGREADSPTYGGWGKDDPQDVTSLPYTNELNDVPTLEEMTCAALNVLDNNPNGFFAMIEGGAVDWASHCNSTCRMIEEQIEFNDAVRAAVRWVNQNSNWEETLIIVTGDHECGYLTGPESGVNGEAVWNDVVNNGKGELPGTEWHSRYHTNLLIPTYAKGPGADFLNSFADEYDPVRGKFIKNSEVGQAMLSLWKKQEIVAPKNVVFLISDGWGYNHIKATDYYTSGFLGAEAYERFPVHFPMSTYSTTNDGYQDKDAWSDFEYIRRYDLPPYSKATDSAASATAMSSGVKSYNGAINVDAIQNPVESIVEKAEKLGKATGVVTSVPFNHATPAGMVAHNVTRNDYQGIADEMIFSSGLDVIMGAGHPWYDDDNQLKDEAKYKYMTEETWNKLSVGEAGNDADFDGVTDLWSFIDDPQAFHDLAVGPTPKRLFGLAQVYSTLQQGREAGSETYGGWGKDDPQDVTSLPYTNELNDVPSLKDMTVAALNVLDADKDGFFAMIEGGAVDWASHCNSTCRMIEEQIDFNDAVDATIRWVNQNSNWNETLVIVTGDHECGYLTGPNSGPDGAPVWNDIVNNGAGNLPGTQWHSRYHTNALIPLYAKGPGSELFALHADEQDTLLGAFIDNAEIGQVLHYLYDNAYPGFYIVPSDVFQILSVKDVANDQGKQVRITWSRHAADAEGMITGYSIYRKIDPNMNKYANAGIAEVPAGQWDFVVIVPATQQATYSTVVPTLKDSTIAEGMYETTFYVMAHTQDAETHYETVPMDGYSVDNLSPAMLQNLMISFLDNSNVLTWKKSDAEDLAAYRIFRGTTPDFTADENSVIAQVYATEYMDKDVKIGDTYYYAIAAIDFAGNQGDLARVQTTTGVASSADMPTSFTLEQNYPNPFNPSTTISYAVPEYAHVTLAVYNVLGEEVARLVDEAKPAGRYTADWNAANCGSGLYLYKLESGPVKMFRKMQLVK